MLKFAYMSIKVILQKSVIPLIFFYLLSALEVSVGEYIQTFGDEYDTYVPSNEGGAKAVKEITKLPSTTSQIIPSFSSFSNVISGNTLWRAYENTIFLSSSAIPIHLRLLRLLI